MGGLMAPSIKLIENPGRDATWGMGARGWGMEAIKLIENPGRARHIFEGPPSRSVVDRGAYRADSATVRPDGTLLGTSANVHGRWTPGVAGNSVAAGPHAFAAVDAVGTGSFPCGNLLIPI